MLKWMGMLCILTGAVGTGRYFFTYFRMHFEQLVGCREIFAQMDAGREYLRLPYAQLLKRAAKGKREVFADMLCEVADAMEQNQEADAGALWNQAFLKRKKEILLKEEEKDLFLALAKSLMLAGDHGQVSRLYFLQLDDRIQKAMEEKKEKQKLYGAVSVLGGLFLVILLF